MAQFAFVGSCGRYVPVHALFREDRDQFQRTLRFLVSTSSSPVSAVSFPFPAVTRTVNASCRVPTTKVCECGRDTYRDQ